MKPCVQLTLCACVKAMVALELSLASAASHAGERAVPLVRPAGAASAALLPMAAKTYRLTVPTGAADPAEVPTIRLSKGDVVDLVLSSKTPGKATVHGLTDEANVPAGGTSTIRVVASVTGRFALHFHGPGGTHTPVATLEIGPR
jgi:hypothetical protein